MEENNTYVGMDVHKDRISVAMYVGKEKRCVEWEIANQKNAIEKLARKLKREGVGRVECCYEAGPCGYVLQRQLKGYGLECMVVAPSLIPVKPGQKRIKTDRRDARKLAELLRAGMLTEVHPPTPKAEALRDLCRAREDVQEDLLRSRHRLSKYLLRQGHVYPGKSRWGVAHRTWLRSLIFEYKEAHMVLDAYLLAVEQAEERLRHLTVALEEMSREEPWKTWVGWLRSFRGIDTITAMTIVTEIHDIDRFHNARDLMSYLGLVSSEHSTGNSVHRGGITHAGNAHLRRVIVEAAWHYQKKPSVSKSLCQRREEQPGWVIAIADKAQQRLHRRYWHLIMSNRKPPGKAIVAVARELVGFIWATMMHARMAA